MKKDKTLAELLAGILLIGVLQQIVLLIFFDNHGYHAIGLWCGILAVVICVIHMKRTIEDALDLGEEKRATRHVQKSYIVRVGIVSILIGVTLYFKVGNPVTILTGITALKLAAYMQPFMHKVFLKVQAKQKGGTLSGE